MVSGVALVVDLAGTACAWTGAVRMRYRRSQMGPFGSRQVIWPQSSSRIRAPAARISLAGLRGDGALCGSWIGAGSWLIGLILR